MELIKHRLNEVNGLKRICRYRMFQFILHTHTHVKCYEINNTFVTQNISVFFFIRIRYSNEFNTIKCLKFSLFVFFKIEQKQDH